MMKQSPVRATDTQFSDEQARELYSGCIQTARNLSDRPQGALQSEMREAAAMFLGEEIRSIIAKARGEVA